MRNELNQEARLYWSFRDELVMIDIKAMKNRQIKIPPELQQQAL